MKDRRTIKILGIEVDRLSMPEALDIFEALLPEEGCSQIVTLNPEMIVEARSNGAYRELLKDSALVLPDGIGVVYASRIVGDPLSERVTGIDFARSALALLAEKGGAAFFLGAKPGIAEAAAAKMAEDIPGLRIAGTHDGYFESSDEDRLIEEINASGADMLLLALGAPKQEFFAYDHRDRLKCRVAIGVGGSFDVWSGTLRRAPRFYIEHNIEWLYRLLQEPKRIKRIIKLPFFLLKVAVHKER